MLIISAALPLAGCFEKSMSALDFQANWPKVSVYRVPDQLPTLTPALRVIGKAGVASVDIKAKVTSTVRRISFSDGESFKKGDLLFDLDDDLFKARLVESERELRAARKIYREAVKSEAATEALVAPNGAGQPVIKMASTQANQAHDQYVAALASRNSDLHALQQCRVVAPFDGVVSFIGVRVGQAITPGEKMAVVTPVKSQWVDFDLLEHDYQALSAGGSIAPTVVMTFSDGSSAPATLAAPIESHGDTINLRSEPKTPSPSFIPGDDVHVEIQGSPVSNLLTLPRAAIRNNAGDSYVFVVDGDTSRVSARSVAVVRWGDSPLYVYGGVQPGERIVTSNFTKIRDGGRVNVEADGPK
jgi:RND family efflux transporter MFP subunit